MPIRRHEYSRLRRQDGAAPTTTSEQASAATNGAEDGADDGDGPGGGAGVPGGKGKGTPGRTGGKSNGAPGPQPPVAAAQQQQQASAPTQGGPPGPGGAPSPPQPPAAAQTTSTTTAPPPPPPATTTTTSPPPPPPTTSAPPPPPPTSTTEPPPPPPPPSSTAPPPPPSSTAPPPPPPPPSSTSTTSTTSTTSSTTTDNPRTSFITITQSQKGKGEAPSPVQPTTILLTTTPEAVTVTQPASLITSPFPTIPIISSVEFTTATPSTLITSSSLPSSLAAKTRTDPTISPIAMKLLIALGALGVISLLISAGIVLVRRSKKRSFRVLSRASTMARNDQQPPRSEKFGVTTQITAAPKEQPFFLPPEKQSEKVTEQASSKTPERAPEKSSEEPPEYKEVKPTDPPKDYIGDFAGSVDTPKTTETSNRGSGSTAKKKGERSFSEALDAFFAKTSRSSYNYKLGP